MTITTLDAPVTRASPTTRVDRALELRQYTLHPGQRDSLIELFEREFIEPQEAVGMHVLGSFRDLDAPDRFVWLRGFPDMPTRAASLAAFYGGPVWRAHRAAANATMIDSDNVLLLRPIRPLGGFALPPRAAVDAEPGLVIATVHYLRASDPAAFTAMFERAWLPRLWDANIAVLATLVSETAPNNFPALPVRTGESVFVWISRHASLQGATEAQARLDEALEWAPQFADELATHLARPSDVLRLQPTARSRLRG